jgi:hypothetical protein
MDVQDGARIAEYDQGLSSALEQLREARAFLLVTVDPDDVIHGSSGLALTFDGPVSNGAIKAFQFYIASHEYVCRLQARAHAKMTLDVLDEEE